MWHISQRNILKSFDISEKKIGHFYHFLRNFCNMVGWKQLHFILTWNSFIYNCTFSWSPKWTRETYRPVSVTQITPSSLKKPEPFPHFRGKKFLKKIPKIPKAKQSNNMKQAKCRDHLGFSGFLNHLSSTKCRKNMQYWNTDNIGSGNTRLSLY